MKLLWFFLRLLLVLPLFLFGFILVELAARHQEKMRVTLYNMGGKSKRGGKN